MQVQKSAKHYTEAAEDEIKLLMVCTYAHVFRGDRAISTSPPCVVRVSKSTETDGQWVAAESFASTTIFDTGAHTANVGALAHAFMGPMVHGCACMDTWAFVHASS